MAIEKRKKKTEREKIAILLEDLTSLESYAKDLFYFLPHPVLLVSSARIILEANPAFEEITGYKTGEVIGKSMEEFFGKGRVEDLLKATFDKGFVRAEEGELFNKRGDVVLVSVSTMLRKNEKGEIVGFFLGLFDLTNIKKTERDLRDAQAALANILEDAEEARARAEEEKNKTLSIITNFVDGLLVFDKENKLSLINPQAESFFGVGRGKAVGKPILELGSLPSLEPLVKLVGKEIKGVFRKELQVKETLTLEVSTVPITRKEEELGTLVILHDITREKIIERMKTEFVSVAAHQLRTPLSAIKWTLRMLLDGDLGPLTQEQKDFIEKTYKSNERMIGLINDLLNVTRIEEGRYLYRPILLDIKSIVQSLVNLYKEEAEKKKIKIEFKKPEKSLPRLMLDKEKITLAIQNLLENAIRYTPRGGQVKVSLKHVKKEVEFSVKDTGVGIPRDQQGNIFTKFFRGANVLRMETEGSGLGLFIAKNVIEAHGGKIWFESEENVGTTFYFTIPAQEEFPGFLKEF